MLMYIELKSGYSDDGPAWIGRVKYSKSRSAIYFNGKMFQRTRGFYYNYYDAETRENYWISGVKKNGQDRHWAGHGKIMIQKSAVQEYLEFRGLHSLDPNRYEITEIPESYPVERFTELANKRNSKS